MRLREAWILPTILVAALLVRLGNWTDVFGPSGVLLDGPDAYYHLHRAALTWQQWPAVPQIDGFLNAPVGGVISWPPLFDGLLATLVLPFRNNPRQSLEILGALVPPLLGILQIVALYRLMLRLSTARAAVTAALVAAILPALVRYTLIGVLDHDPFFELSVLIALGGLALAARDQRPSAYAAAQVSIGLVLAILSWGGSLVGIAIVGMVGVAVAVTSKEMADAVGSTLAIGGAATALGVLPFVLRSEWTRRDPFTFEGLSLLHEIALAAVVFCGALLTLAVRPTGRRLPLILASMSGLVLALLLPSSFRSFLSGVRYAGGEAAILELVAEARPLLYLLGPFDLRPLFARLGLLPLVAILLLPWAIAARSTRVAAVFVGTWSAVSFGLALLHSRFSFTAAIALSAFAGVAWEFLRRRPEVRPRGLATAAALTLLPMVTAYLSVPGWEAHNFYRRVNPLRQFEMDRIGAALRSQPKLEPRSAVMAPWYLGHWIVWFGERRVVLSPMLSVGQSEFQAGMRFFFAENPTDALRFLRLHQVRYLLLTPELQTLESRARVSGVDPSRYLSRDPQTGENLINLPVYMRTVAARLTFWGPRQVEAFGDSYPELASYREILRSTANVPGPFGPVPLVRVYEVQ